MFRRSPSFISALDIGSDKTRALIAQLCEADENSPSAEADWPSQGLQQAGRLKIVGMAEEVSRGIRCGEIVDIDEAAASIKAAVEAASVMASVDVKEVVVSFNGRYSKAVNSVGTISLAGVSPSNDVRPVREIGDEDLQRALKDAKSITVRSDERVLHAIGQDFAVDESEYIKDPRGKTAGRLAARVQFIIASQRAINDLDGALARARLSGPLKVLQSLASIEACLKPEEIEEGTLLLDIGKGTTHAIIVYAGAPRYARCVVVGGDYVTADVAECLGCNTSTAERVKIETGCGYEEPCPTEGRIDTLAPLPHEGTPDPKVVTAIAARYAELFLALKSDICRAQAQHYVKRGVVLTGGGSCCSGLLKLASGIFGVAARKGLCAGAACFDGALQHPRFSTVAGLLLYSVDPARRMNSFAETNRSMLRRAWDALTCKQVVLT